ncbi:MAG: hypothetical protein LBF89_06195 [Bacteroidales bacterium]|nr:hypothetical protein [Bacteroidales bacterium]
MRLNVEAHGVRLNVKADGVRLKARKPSALENAERPYRTFKRDGKKAGNKPPMEQPTDP